MEHAGNRNIRMHRALTVGCLSVLPLALAQIVACATPPEKPEAEGDSQSNIIIVEGDGRLSVTVSVKQDGNGVPAKVNVKCGGANARDNLTGTSDEEGILFPLVLPTDCTIVATVAATGDKPETKIEMKHAGKAQIDTVVNGEAEGGYTATATFGEPYR